MCKYGFKNVLISSKNFPMESYFAERIICFNSRSCRQTCESLELITCLFHDGVSDLIHEGKSRGIYEKTVFFRFYNFGAK